MVRVHQFVSRRPQKIPYVVSWVPDSTAVIVMEDHGGNERYQLFRIDIDNP